MLHKTAEENRVSSGAVGLSSQKYFTVMSSWSYSSHSLYIWSNVVPKPWSWMNRRGWQVIRVRSLSRESRLDSYCSPLPLQMEEGFAVWWRCVLTQWGDEDGILMGLIELMVLSPLVGEECQASLWLCASWLLSAGSDSPSPSLVVIFCLPTLWSVLFCSFSLPFSVLYLFIPHYCPNR